MGLGCTCGIGQSLCLHVTIWGAGLVKKRKLGLEATIVLMWQGCYLYSHMCSRDSCILLGSSYLIFQVQWEGGGRTCKNTLDLTWQVLYGHFSMSYSGVWTTGGYVERVERHAAVKPVSINQSIIYCVCDELLNFLPVSFAHYRR